MNDAAARIALDYVFLSCLSGSEQSLRGVAEMNTFLSCLSGSELQISIQPPVVGFLSCLSGSEHQATRRQQLGRFSELPIRQ